MTTIIVRTICALAILASVGCSDGGHYYNAGDVVRDYYSRIQTGQFDSAMELWDPRLVDKQKKWGLPWPQALARMQRDFGALESFELFSQADTQAGSGDRVLSLTYQVQYERARVPERVVVRIPTHSDAPMAITNHDIMNAEARR
ncbi:MAG: hypothetical protein JRG76_14605 [Deltaproteobacteria bacterium]|nr:hypothetical protein [Deltaproteobacteria bacterium]MBW2415733.1 hypothetical protein [Deltaproteobacteria bacterium]